ncbi:RHS repeat domain-containing protein [Aquimarina algiphila]|uniref:RHS repeat-associated core domain-containing protein n=1 Tax=Aquimarina algiphila TaxID=2047982 RepID=A0A554VBF2_9FLAO|nr:RHS repeat-associated core domain-containing protein [Aquimarina algiphila]TSE03799.1 hypothetical protein FOF46_28425 [Aquimarina algiphila]
MLWIFITNTAGNITYIYDATGAKLKKIAPSGSSLIETEYAGNYIYKNGNLEFFNHPEGYVEKEADEYKYVYQFKDHLGNIRLSYKDVDKNGSISQNEIVEEKNYYPFGLEHKGYNNTIVGREHNYQTYQGQEFTEDLGVNILEFEFRAYDPAIGRFWQVDPLAEDYAYQSVYNFAENRVIDGNELEGLEWTRFENPDGSTHYTVHFKVLNSTTDRSFGKALNSDQVTEYADAIKDQTETSFTGKDADGNDVTVSATYEIVESADDIDTENDFYVEMVDKVTVEGKSEAETHPLIRIAAGKTKELGNPTSNRIQVSSFINNNAQEAGSTGAHELGHTAGLMHQDDDNNPQHVVNSMERNNLMHRPQHLNTITPQQRSEVRRVVPRVRPVNTINSLGIKKL